VRRGSDALFSSNNDVGGTVSLVRKRALSTSSIEMTETPSNSVQGRPRTALVARAAGRADTRKKVKKRKAKTAPKK
jgi:hypothetical protein